MNRVYIAGKVTGQNRIDCLQKFQAAENLIRTKGNYEIINPMKLVPEGTSWKMAMKICLRALITCDTLYVLPDWHESNGARLEMDIAIALELEILNIFLKKS